MKPKCICDYVFLEENADPSCSLLKSSLFLHLARETLFLIFKRVSGSPQHATTFPKLSVYVPLLYIQHSSWFSLRQSNTRCSLPARRNQEHFRRDLFRRAGGVWVFLLAHINYMIRLKSLDLLRPSSNRTPLCWSINFKHWDFLKCLLPHQEPWMMQPPSKILPIYFHKRLPWNALESHVLTFVWGAELLPANASTWPATLPF